MLKPTEIVALSKAIKTKDAKNAMKTLDEGLHTVDFLIHVFGTLDIKDTEKNSTCSIPLLKALALALHYAGCQRDNLLPTLEKTIRQSMALGQNEICKVFADEKSDPDGTKFWDKIEEMEKRIKKEVISKLDKTPVRNSNAKLHVKELTEETVEEIEKILKSA